MKKSSKNGFRRYISIYLVITFALSSLAITTSELFKRQTVSAQNLNSEEMKLAADISNMTGVSKEEIIKLKNQSKDWNEVLQKLGKDKDLSQNKNDKMAREDLLTESAIDENLIETLKREGFSNDEITDAKMLIDRVRFSLREITSNTEKNDAISVPDGLSNLSKVPQAVIPDAKKITGDIFNPLKTESSNNEENKQGEDISLYSEIASKIDDEKALIFLLKLKKDFESIEKVMDEYLLSLQIEVNLETYLADKKAYEKEKAEKSVGLDAADIITLEKIEARMLEKIQSENSMNKSKMDSKLGNSQSQKTRVTGGKVDEDLPQIPLPDVKDVRTKDPTLEIMKEINDIRDRSLNLERR